ncbi:hypothetical protein ACIHFD_63710 [Nonomuraea sp. NPDC051941]
MALKGRDRKTMELYKDFARLHILPAIGSYKLRDLSVEEEDRWLAHT